MNSAIGAAFGGLVAVILLLLFSASTFYMVSSVISFCASTNPCVSPPAGLVSALVIAQLSITEPGKPPTLGSFRPEGSAATMVTSVVALYLLAWIATGLAALVVGVMLYPKVNQTLADIGSTWLGLAVSAAYAYFGLTPKQTDSEARSEARPEARTKGSERVRGRDLRRDRAENQAHRPGIRVAGQKPKPEDRLQGRGRDRGGSDDDAEAE
ncbi:MAG: hypothetical protein ACJ8D8_11505 [Microvirga sp.]